MSTITALHLIITTTLARMQDRLADDRGQTSIEWLGIAAVIVAIVLAMTGGPATVMGDAIKDAFTQLTEDVL